jgi:hypothetical protein
MAARLRRNHFIVLLLWRPGLPAAIQARSLLFQQAVLFYTRVSFLLNRDIPFTCATQVKPQSVLQPVPQKTRMV